MGDAEQDHPSGIPPIRELFPDMDFEPWERPPRYPRLDEGQTSIPVRPASFVHGEGRGQIDIATSAPNERPLSKSGINSTAVRATNTLPKVARVGESSRKRKEGAKLNASPTPPLSDSPRLDKGEKLSKEGGNEGVSEGGSAGEASSSAVTKTVSRNDSTGNEMVAVGRRVFWCNFPNCQTPGPFERGFNLERHKSRLHITKKLYRCRRPSVNKGQRSDCDKGFSTESQRDRHELVHGEPTYQCIECKRKFHRKDALTRHSKIHKTQEFGGAKTTREKPETVQNSQPAT